jgi:predicted short-subunit dehydrogenase-like oxidoreductase (DUF2520 family)
MVSVIIIGSGNVAQHLIRAFSATENVDVVQAYARQPEKLYSLLPKEKVTANLSTLADADVYIISVSDNAIADVATNLPFTGKLVVHTSGSTGMEALGSRQRNGVFYPLQTFSVAKAVNFKEVPLCLETEHTVDMPMLETLAHALSEKVYHINGTQRQALHVAAVFSCNFVNHLYGIGARVCSDNNIPFDILKPLILETADKINTLTPTQAQTGPAVRRDSKTIQRQLNFLQDDTLKEIYTLITNSIQHTHE